MTIEEVKQAYNDTLSKKKTEGMSQLEIKEKQETLRKQYVDLLPKNERLAIWLHHKLCHLNHSTMCSFYHEINGLRDDWEGGAQHKKYLNKADEALKVTDDNDELVKEVIRAVL